MSVCLSVSSMHAGFKSLCMRHQGITSCTAVVLAPGVIHSFTGSLCIDLRPGWATRVVSSRRTRNGSGRGRGYTSASSSHLAEATVVLARQILSRHDGQAD